MTFEEFAALCPDKQRRAAQDIWAPPEHPIFQGIKDAFLQGYPVCIGHGLWVGAASSLGPLNAITVTTQTGKRLDLPKEFMGLPVIRARLKRPSGKPSRWSFPTSALGGLRTFPDHFATRESEVEMILDGDDFDPIHPVGIEHSIDEIWEDDTRKALQERYNFLDYHFEKDGLYCRARAYLDEPSSVTLFGPFVRRGSIERATNATFADDVTTYLRRRFRKVKTL